MSNINIDAASNVASVYSGLMDTLEKGNRAMVATRCLFAEGSAPDVAAFTGMGGAAKGYGGAVSYELISEDDRAAWAGLEARMYDSSSDSAFIHDGPVSHRVFPGGLEMIEKYTPRPRMIILGGGHIALALVKMAAMLDFHTIVFDDRPKYANDDRFPEADEVICDDFSRVFERLSIRATDYVVIVTRGHLHDTESLTGVLKGEIPTYMGMIGSGRRVKIVLSELEGQGFKRELLDTVHTPIGLRIGAVTPSEIAVSIMAEIIEVKRKGAGLRSGLTSNVEIAGWLAQNADKAEALMTILQTSGSVPRETGAKMALDYAGHTAGSIGGGCAEGDATHHARTVIREGGFEIVSVDTTDTAEEDGMACGGRIKILITHV